MGYFFIRRFFFLLFLTSFTVGRCNAQFLHEPVAKNDGKGFFSKLFGSKNRVRVRESRRVIKAKKKQEANKRRLDKKYAEIIKNSRQRAFDIQTPEVQTRMKHNKLDVIKREKEKKRYVRKSNKKAGKKYK